MWKSRQSYRPTCGKAAVWAAAGFPGVSGKSHHRQPGLPAERIDPMRREWRLRFSGLLSAAALVGATAAMADSSGTLSLEPVYAAEQPAAPAKSWVDNVKHPVDWFDWGADFRLRHEHLYNPFLTDVDPPGNEWGFERFRLRVWDTIAPCKEFAINTRLTWEGRHWWDPDSRDGWEESDLIWDNLNAVVRFPKINLTVTAGRQDVILGNGWLVLEGTPLDGSRTIFCNAARATLDMKQAKTAVDLIYVDNYSNPDIFLSPILGEGTALSEQDERGVILWATNKSLERTEIDGFFIWKHDEAVMANGDTGDIYTFGARAVHQFNKTWTGRVEGAYEFGQRENSAMFSAGSHDVSAWGLNSRLDYNFNDPMKNQLHLAFEVLSGDDPSSKTVEQFDPLWGRWPQWSELLVYTWANETRIAEITNLYRANIGWQANPGKDTTVSFDYHALFAYDTPLEGRPGFGSSSFRGHLFTAVLQHKFNRFLAGHLWAEYFIPGGYYDDPGGIKALDTREDPAAYLRGELVFSF